MFNITQRISCLNKPLQYFQIQILVSKNSYIRNNFGLDLCNEDMPRHFGSAHNTKTTLGCFSFNTVPQRKNTYNMYVSKHHIGCPLKPFKLKKQVS